MIIPMYNERNNIASPDEVNGGQNAIRVKIAQMEWLFSENNNIAYEIWFVDDRDPTKSGDIAKKIIENEYSDKNIHVVMFDKEITDSINSKEINPTLYDTSKCNEWAKGGCVLWGLYAMAKINKDYIFYTDLDLLYPLEQCGLLVATFLDSRVGGVVGSRKMNNSYGYYNQQGPNAITILYQRAINEIYKLKDIKDVQAGFKCFNGIIIQSIIKEMKDKKLSFDGELLSLFYKEGWSIAEVGIVTLHMYKENIVGTPRNYDQMLLDSEEYAKMHHIYRDDDEAKVWNLIKMKGGIYNTAEYIDILSANNSNSINDIIQQML